MVKSFLVNNNPQNIMYLIKEINTKLYNYPKIKPIPYFTI